MNFNEHPTLFDTDSTHDYGGEFDNDDMGHEFPFVRVNNEISQDTTEEHPKSVSVSLAERALALSNVAEMYGRYSRSAGLSKAVETPKYRQEIGKRYQDVDDVASRATVNSSYSPEIERQILQPILKEQELIDLGFEEADVDLIAKSTIHDVRQSFGVDAGYKKRQKNLKIANREIK